MLRYSTGKIVSILLLTVLGFLYAAPNLMTPETRKAI